MNSKASLKTDFLFTSIYAFVHFVIDFACVSSVLLCAAAHTDALDPATALFLIVLYDMAAFAFQMPVGAIMDHVNKNAKLGVLSCLLVIAAVAFATGSPVSFGWLAVALAAAGNAILHCAGGIDVLNLADGRASLPGAFIGAGAAGVFLASVMTGILDSATIAAILSFLLLLSAFLLLCLDAENAKEKWSVNLPFEVPHLAKPAIIGFALLFLTVALRSYAGMCMAFPWKGDFTMAVVAVAAVMLGKAFGGFVADRFGFVRTSAASLGCAGVLFIFSWASPACGILATFLFNFTMPITLVSMSNMFPNAKGLAFGSTTFALSIGFAPVALGFTLADPMCLAALAFISLAALVGGLVLSGQERRAR